MKILFLSNTYNHHQSALSQALFQQLQGAYVFIQTKPMTEERKSLGWETELPAFVKRSYDSLTAYKECIELIKQADVVIAGSAPEKMVSCAIREKKLVFRYSERIYKNKKKLLQLPLRAIKYFWNNRFSKNIYLLAASAYTAADYAKTFTFLNKAYKWGYFPEVKRYRSIGEIIEKKKNASILWAGRLIGWKHPDIPIRIAERLKQEGYFFRLSIIGNGEKEGTLKDMVKNAGLGNCVHMLGAIKPEEVRKYMEESQIFLFTSDFNEGWGAVLNESMNSGCAVVASHAIGAVPFLMKDKENGLIYRNGDLNDLYCKVKYLLDNPDCARELGANAYRTMEKEWNAENAAERLISLSEALLSGVKRPDIYREGPCSKAEKLKNGWF